MAGVSGIASYRQGRGSRGGVVEELDREWAVLVRVHRGSARNWAAAHRALAGADSFDDLIALSTSESDPVLAALLAEVAKGNNLAGRVVLQSMLGRMVAMGRRDPYAGVGDYVSALWCVITSYPLARRPRSIAANLAMESLKIVSAERRWLPQGDVVPWPPIDFIGADLPPAACSLQPVDLEAARILRAGVDLELIDDHAHDLLCTIYLDGFSGVDAARRHRSTPGSVRVRCNRAVSRLAAHAAMLAEAA